MINITKISKNKQQEIYMSLAVRYLHLFATNVKYYQDISYK